MSIEEQIESFNSYIVNLQKLLADQPHLKDIQKSWEMATEIICNLKIKLEKEQTYVSSQLYAERSKNNLYEHKKKIKKTEKDYFKRIKNNE